MAKVFPNVGFQDILRRLVEAREVYVLVTEARAQLATESANERSQSAGYRGGGGRRGGLRAVKIGEESILYPQSSNSFLDSEILYKIYFIDRLSREGGTGPLTEVQKWGTKFLSPRYITTLKMYTFCEKLAPWGRGERNPGGDHCLQNFAHLTDARSKHLQNHSGLLHILRRATRQGCGF